MSRWTDFAWKRAEMWVAVRASDPSGLCILDGTLLDQVVNKNKCDAHEEIKDVGKT